MSNDFRINSWMKKILIELQGKTLTRQSLIEKATLIPKYSEPKQAKMFVSRNVHALTKQGLLFARGKIKQRTYELSPSLKDILFSVAGQKISEKRECLENEIDDLILDERKVTAELKILLSEIETYQELHQRFPSKKHEISSLIDSGRERSATLYGRLNAIRNVIKLSEQSGHSQC